MTDTTAHTNNMVDERPGHAVKRFTYGSTELYAMLRTVEENGEPWFIAQDILEILDLNRSSLASLDDDEKGVHTMDTLGGRQKVATINESGLYSLILRSRKPEAKAFKRWITGTVLPTLRKTGTYSTAPALTDDELIHKALSISTERVAALTEKVAELEPKAELADNYLNASAGSRLVGEAAKILDMKEKQLRAFLLSEKLIFVKHAACGNVQYDHYAEFAPHFEPRETVVNHTWGSCNHYTLRITPRGIDLIRKRLRDQKEVA